MARMKAPIFLEAVLVMKTKQQSQSNLEEKDSTLILNDDIFQGKTRSFSRQ